MKESKQKWKIKRGWNKKGRTRLYLTEIIRSTTPLLHWQ